MITVSYSFPYGLRTNKAGTVTALELEDKSELDEELKESYQNAGIAHILSLSGLLSLRI